MNTYKGLLYAFLSSAAFGFLPIFASIAYKNGSNPTTVLIFRFLLSSIFLFIYLLYKKINIKIEKKPMILLLGIGFIAYTLTTETLFMSYNYLGAGLSTTLHFIYPTIVCVVGFTCFKEKVSKRKILSLLLSGIGVYSLVAFETKTLSMFGIFLALFSGVAYAINVIVLGFDSIKAIDNKISTLYMCIGATLGMFIYGLATKSVILNFNAKTIGSYMGISSISTITSILLLLKAIDLIGTSSASILGTFEPIVSIIFGVILLDEKLSIYFVISAVLILSATVVLARDNNENNLSVSSSPN